MALVQTKWRLSINWVETSGKSVRRTYEAPLANFADYDAVAVNVTAALTGFIAQNAVLTNSVVGSFQIEGVYVQDDLVLPADAENQSEALISFKIVGDPTDSGNLSIPAAADGIFVSPTGEGHDIVDTSDAALVLWLNHFIGDEWTVSDGEYVDLPTIKGHRRSVKSSNT